jgi:hypothetical protein
MASQMHPQWRCGAKLKANRKKPKVREQATNKAIRIKESKIGANHVRFSRFQH